MASIEYTKQFVSSLVLDKSPRVKLVDGAGKSEEWKRFKRVYIDGQPVEFAACVACMKTVLYKPKNGTNNMRGHRCLLRERKKSISLLEPKKEINVQKCANDDRQLVVPPKIPESNESVERPIAISIIPKLADMRCLTILPVKEESSTVENKLANIGREEPKVHEPIPRRESIPRDGSMKPFVNQFNQLKAELNSLKNEVKALRSRVTYLERENVILKRTLIAATPQLNSDEESGLLPDEEESIFKHII